ncbi:MAG: succinate dehydrogenase, cytochrome b556 subunit [Gammaproteobacteria bacterium]|nr:succinate dehydrogenase, cytochrome b556 subunit [Gammaproteobacteria bacterium]
MNGLRTHRSYVAFLGHRLSGIALAIFLPIHFIVLGLALSGAENLDRMLAFTDLALVKFAEWGLVMLLSIHLFFGVRVLMLELTKWPNRTDPRSDWIVPSVIAALAIGVVFLLQL